MAPKRKSAGTGALPIEVNFFGNQSIYWPLTSPASSGAGSSHASTASPTSPPTGDDNKEMGESQSLWASSLPTTNEEVKQEFISFVRTKIGQLQGNPQDHQADFVDDSDKCDFAEEKKTHLSLLAIALDPSAEIKDLMPSNASEQLLHRRSLEEHFSFIYKGHIQRIEDISYAWHSARNKDQTTKVTEETRDLKGEAKSDEEEEQDEADDEVAQHKRQKRQDGRSSATSNMRRPPADVKAQQEVPKWYRGRCILSGLIKPQGAHIVPVRTLKVTPHGDIWQMLRCFWPLPAIDELVVRGREVTNILPLCHDVHFLWDRYAFAIRPVEHPTDPQHRMYIQMVWLKDLDTDGGLVSGDWDHDGSGSIADFRRGENGMYPSVKHGDVYEIVTADPDSRPLPSLRLLQMQYGVHKMLAGIRAAGALKIIFSDDPPDDQGLITFNVGVPWEWKGLLEAAVDAGVLDGAAAKRWGRAFTREFVRKARSLGVSLPRLPKHEAPEEDGD